MRRDRRSGTRGQMLAAMTERMALIWVPRKSSATSATMAINPTISAYSTRPCPCCGTGSLADDRPDEAHEDEEAGEQSHQRRGADLVGRQVLAGQERHDRHPKDEQDSEEVARVAPCHEVDPRRLLALRAQRHAQED